MNEDKCRCECKELIDKEVCNEGYYFNPSNCNCECDKSCGIGEYLDYSNCKCKKKLFGKIIEECAENIDEAKLVNKTLDKTKNKDKCNSYVAYKVLFWILFIIRIVIGIYFLYLKYVNHNNNIDLPY